ncbi:MAG: hypothetical protein ACP5QP_00445 [Brevinematia bacterium]
MKKFIVLLGVILVCSGVALPQNKIPDWVSTPVFKKGNDIYFVGFGKDKDKIVARNLAIEDIKSRVIESILVEVASETKRDMSIIVDSAGGEEVINKLSSEISVKGKARIFVPTPEDEASYQDKDGNYVVYLLVKYPQKKIDEERARIEQMYKDMVKSVDKFIEEGDNYVKEGKLVNAIASYTIAAKNSIGVEERQMFYPEIIKKMDDLISRISIEVVEGNNKNVVVGQNGVIKFGVYYNYEGNKVPVKDANLIFRVVSGGAEINNSATSGTDGVAVCEVSKVSRFDNKKLTVRAFLNLDFSGLMNINKDTKRDASRLIGKARLVYAEASWYMNVSKSKSAVVVVVSYKGNDFAYDPSLSSSLGNVVIKKGYKVSRYEGGNAGDDIEKYLKFTKGNLLVFVKINKPESKVVEFGDVKQSRIEVNGTIEIYDDGNLINSEDFKFSNTTESAMKSNLPSNLAKKLEDMTF